MLLGRGDNADHHRSGKGDDEAAAETRNWELMKTSMGHHGFPSVSFVCCQEEPEKNLKNCVATSCQDSKTLRKYIDALIKDANIRKDMVRDMVITSSKLREEQKMSSELTKIQQQTINDMQEKLQTLQPWSGMQSKEVESSMYRERCLSLEVEVRLLNQKISDLQQQEEDQRSRSDRVFEDLAKRLGRERMDSSVIAIIDRYERKLSKSLNSQLPRKTSSEETPSIDFKFLMKTYDNKLDASNRTIKQLETTNKLLKKQLQDGPTRASGRCRTNIRVPDDKSSSDKSNGVLSRGRSLKLSDLKQRSPSLCRKCPEAACKEYDATKSDPKHQISQQLFEQESFNREIAQLINASRNLRRPCEHLSHGSVCRERRCMIDTLEEWTFQLNRLKDLQESLKNLSAKLFPWQPVQLNGRVCSVSELIEVVDRMGQSGLCKKICKHDDLKGVEREELVGVVLHFQKLFDVPNLSGVLTRMSQLYMKLNENFNLMSNVKQLLGLEKTASSTVVVEKISRLTTSSASCLSKSLGTEEFDSLVDKLDEESELCSVYHETVQDIMQLIGANNIRQVVPLIKNLAR